MDRGRTKLRENSAKEAKVCEFQDGRVIVNEDRKEGGREGGGEGGR